MKTSLNTAASESIVLSKALMNVLQFYELTGKDIYEIIGISEASTTRLHQGKKLISPHTKEGEMALLLIRIYRALNALLGNHPEKAKLWLRSYNTYFHATPLEHLKTISGLVDVVHYLDAMRGKL